MPESEDWPRGRPDPEESDTERVRDMRSGSPAAAARMSQQHLWVDLQVQQAMERGDFDDLPGAGRPIKDLGAHHDPDWWLKQLVERERIAVLPPSLQLRKDDAELDGRLDAMSAEREVREAVEQFNARVMRARYTPAEGPPLITQPRDVEATVAAWQERRAQRRTSAAAEQARQPPHRARRQRRRRWWRRWRAG